MGSRMGGWRPALRIARRDMLRARGRTALIAVMVGVPVALVTCLASVYATDQVSDIESIPGRLGATAAELQVYSSGPVWQDPTMTQFEVATPDGQADLGGEEAQSTEATMHRLQKLTGGRIIDVPTTQSLIRTDRGRLDATVLLADVTTAQLRGLVQVERGRVPRSDDEVLVSHSLADRGYTVGSTVALDDGARSTTVVGVGAAPSVGAPTLVVALPNALPVAAEGLTHRYLLDRPTPVTWAEVQRLNQAGVIAFSRAVVQQPPSGWQSTLPSGAQYWDRGVDPAQAAVLVLVVFSIVLEIVLLAGPAFAVGVRRQSRQLALVAAAGGSARDVRRVVLAQGIAVGVGASVLGAAAGVGLARVLAWGLPRYSGTTLGPWDLDRRATGAALLLGALAAVLASWVPARTASRADVVVVLAGRRGQTRTRRGWPVLGALLVAAGVAVAVTVGIRPGGEFGVAGGTLLMVLGTIATMPAMIGLVGRIGRHLPLPLRLAVRDSARQRGRTAPAVAAVMAAVAGVTALAIGASSDSEQARLEYEPRQPAGVTTVQAPDLDAQGWSAVDRAVTAQTGRSLVPTGTLGTRTDDRMGYETPTVYVRLPGCPAVPETLGNGTDDRCFDWQADSSHATGTWSGRGPVVADVDVLTALGYPIGSQQRQVLESGGVLVSNRQLVVDGKAAVAVYRAMDDGTATDVHTMTVPAAYVPSRQAPGSPVLVDLFLTPATARAHNLPWLRDGGVLSPVTDGSGTMTRDAQDRLSETLSGITPNLEVYTERGFVSDLSLPLFGLALVGALAVLVGTLTATGLALADSRPDLATLAAIGARPRTRRVMAAAQALVIGLFGAVTGVLVGLVPGVAVTWPLTSNQYGSSGSAMTHGPTIAIPWLTLVGLAVAVPVIAALFAGTVVRSRLPLTRRLGQ